MLRHYSMAKIARALGTLVLLSSLCAGAATHAGAAEPAFMRLGRQAPPPPGYLALCRRLPSECGLRGASTDLALAPQSGTLRPTAAGFYQKAPEIGREAYDWKAALGVVDTLTGTDSLPPPEQARLPFNRRLLTELQRVSRAVNSRISATSDMDAFGQEDFWALPLTEGLGHLGNCKHYALEKRKTLIDNGVDPAALSIAVVRTPSGEVHAVLVVSTTTGDYVLDNLSPWVVKWSQTGYTWIIRQGSGQPLAWFSVLT